VAHPRGCAGGETQAATKLSDPLLFPLIIGDTREDTPNRLAVNAPRDGRLLGLTADADAEAVDRAVRAAYAALPGWRATPPLARADAIARYARLLDESAELLAGLVADEVGKPLAEAQAEVARAIEVVHHFAGEAGRQWHAHLPAGSVTTGSTVRPEPVGVVAAITPWNFPVALVIWKLAPAIAAGCTVIVKPAQEAPLAAWTLVDLACRSGLPPGVVNVVTGDGPTVGEALATHPLVAKVAFTGSRRVAEIIAAWASPRLKHLSLELGGHGALVVLPDADLDTAVDVAISQGYVNTGQACYSVNRVLLTPQTTGPFLERFRARFATLEPGVMATDRGRERHQALLDDARRAGATVEGGDITDERWVHPALVTGAGPGVRLVDEEPFTPIVAVLQVPDVDAAIAETNRPDYGLVNYVCGGDLRACLETANALQSGTVAINGWRVVVPHAPYGGWRGSGLGTELGRPGMEAFCRWQHIRVLA
jgi:succinate-semialdehyde dehydrogenase / glutarate-semialdehyde dehydrogenase